MPIGVELANLRLPETVRSLMVLVARVEVPLTPSVLRLVLLVTARLVVVAFTPVKSWSVVVERTRICWNWDTLVVEVAVKKPAMA